MFDDTVAPFLLPAIRRKKVTVAFDGGVSLLAAAERRLDLADRLARLIADPRNPLFVVHDVADILRARMPAIACSNEDADDLDQLRTDLGFKLMCGRLPDSGFDLCSQPTVPRWENAPTLREIVRLSYVEFTTLRMRLLKLAGRITETATRLRIALATACPEAELFRAVARSLPPAGP